MSAKIETTVTTMHAVKIASAALGGVAAMLAVAACSSTTSTPSQSPASTGPSTAAPAATTPAAPAPQSAVPGPPPGAAQLSTQASGGGSYTRYRTSQAPAAVAGYYTAALKSAGYTITESGGGGGGWGQYGGSGATVDANTAATYVAVNAGGSKQGATYFEICTGTSAAQVDQCQGENHSSSSGS